jgi:hypothetical protein
MPFPVDIKYVTQTEQKLGVKFPASFVVKMVKQNGGSVSTAYDTWGLHPFLDASDRKRLSRTCNDISRETSAAREWPGFPSNAIVIGSNGGGDILILLPQDDNPSVLSHEVFWWDHETGEVQVVADDFSELVS